MRWARGESISHYGGNADRALQQRRAPAEADVYRDGWTNYALDTHAIYLQDTFTREPRDAEPRRAVGPPDRRGAADDRSGEPDRCPTSCRRSTSPAPTRAWCGTTSRRVSA